MHLCEEAAKALVAGACDACDLPRGARHGAQTSMRCGSTCALMRMHWIVGGAAAATSDGSCRGRMHRARHVAVHSALQVTCRRFYM
eukprot:351865-Chlamydomonas_euryale.AAC.3